MNVSCTNCPAKYAVPDEKVRGRKVRITCKRCGAAIIVDGTGGAGDGDSAQQRPQSIQAQSVAPSAQPPAAAAAPSGARAMAKRTMMGVAPPAFGSSAPAPPAPSPPPAAAPAPQRPAVDARKSTMVGGLEPPIEPPPEQQARREVKRTMVGGLEAPALLAAARAATASGGARPAVVVPRTAPEPETKWTVAVTDEQHEEMTVAEAVELYARGTINEETFIWKEGMPDWQMPFELPEFAKALRARGFAPGQPVRKARELEQYHVASGAAPQLPLDSDAEATRVGQFGAPESSGGAPGVWREPGLVGPNREVSFDDVTVAMQAPQAEELLREAGLDRDDDEQRPFNAESQPLSEPMFPVAASRTPPAPPPEGLLAAQAAGPGRLAPPEQFSFNAPSAAAAVAQPSATAARDRPRSAARRDSSEPAQDMFGDAERAERAEQDEAGSAGAQQQKLTGQRNESSVLFSLDALIKADGGAPPEPEKPKRRDEEAILLGSNPQGPKPAPAVTSRDNAPPDSLVNVGGGAMFGSATLAAPDVTAPAPPPSIKKPRPKPETKPGEAPPSSAVASVETSAPRRSGLWIGLIALFFALVGGGGYLYMKRPDLVARMIGRPAPEPTATALENAAQTPPTVAPTATEAPTQSATPTASASGAVAPSATAATDQRRADERRRDEKKEEKAKPAEKPAASAESAPAAPAAGGDSPAFDRAAASSALATAAGSASSCKQPDGPTGSGKVTVTFAPTGRATNAVVTGDLAGTPVGGCVARIFRNARVPPFSGEPITVARSFTIN